MEHKDMCKKFRDVADSYIDGELPPHEAAELERHLVGCEECRRRAAELEALRNAIAESAQEVPDSLHAKIISGLPAPKVLSSAKRSRYARRAAIYAICAIMVLTVIYVCVMFSLGGANSSLPLPPIANSPGATNGDIVSTEYSEERLPEEFEGNVDSSNTKPEFDDITNNSNIESVPPASSSPETVAPDMGGLDDVTDSSSADTVPPTEVSPDATHGSASNSPAPILPSVSNTDAHSNSSDNKYDYAESNGGPGGEEITLALLVVSGLLAVASFIAFLISLSSVRTYSSAKKEDSDTENKE